MLSIVTEQVNIPTNDKKIDNIFYGKKLFPDGEALR